MCDFSSEIVLTLGKSLSKQSRRGTTNLSYGRRKESTQSMTLSAGGRYHARSVEGLIHGARCRNTCTSIVWSFAIASVPRQYVVTISLLYHLDRALPLHSRLLRGK